MPIGLTYSNLAMIIIGTIIIVAVAAVATVGVAYAYSAITDTPVEWLYDW